MAKSIKESVGVGGENYLEDIKIVQTRLNLYVAAARLGFRTPLAVDGNVALTIPYIQDFQKLVMGFNYPDGKVDRLPGKSMAKLMEDPPDPFGVVKCNALAIKNVLLGPVGGVSADLWNAALQSLARHSSNPKLTRWHLLTLVDFGLSNLVNRLWLVDLYERKTLFHTLVAHGGGRKNDKGKAIDRQEQIPHRFGDDTGQNFSSLGPFISLDIHKSNLGNLEEQPAMKIIGLQPGVNGRALNRGLLFHGASYVKRGSVGNSHGCFSTMPEINPSLVDTIKNGSFIFAYHSKFQTAEK